jgi:hypothetical protein
MTVFLLLVGIVLFIIGRQKNHRFLKWGGVLIFVVALLFLISKKAGWISS